MAGTGKQRLQFESIGADVMIWPRAKIVSPEVVSIGDSVIIDDWVFLMGGRHTRIGSFVHIASFVSITGGGEFEMGDFAGLSSGTRVFTGNDDYSGGSLTGPTVPFPFRHVHRSFVKIGRHAIVGANSVILPGVTIGDGAAIGANSFVRCDLEPWSIYVGTPARRVGSRNRERMLELEQGLRKVVYDESGNYTPREKWRLPSEA